ncbi:MAG: hypothetical protein JXR40_00565 [Pontiellaceae bacterium]|nr:hypothetical protein [Pontiellaceae bacterium]
MNPLQQEIAGASLLLILFLSVIALAEFATRMGWLAPEPARKSVHLTGGLGCLIFPFLVNSWISVIVLAALLSSALYYGERCGKLRSLAAVGRKSIGSLLFPIAVLFLFVVSNEKTWLYIASLLVLVLADTAAALAGTRFGRLHYETFPGQQKTVEGTAVFFLVSFIALYLSLLFLSPFTAAAGLWVAFLMALLLAGLEAVSIGGTDNIFVPIGTWFMLYKASEKSVLELSFQSISLITIAILLLLINRRARTFRTRPMVIFILIGFAVWALGSLEWLIPVLSGLLIYNALCTDCEPLPSDLTARRLMRPLYPSLIILFLANTRWSFDFWFAPFIVATASATTLCIASRFRRDSQHAALSGKKGILALLLPPIISLLLCLPMQGVAALKIMPLVLLLCTTTALSYHLIRRTNSTAFLGAYLITIHASAAALLYAGLQALNLVKPLTPFTWLEVFK